MMGVFEKGERKMTDLSFERHGTLWLMHSHSERGNDWIVNHIPGDAMTFGEGVVIESRFVQDIVFGAMTDGLSVEVESRALELTQSEGDQIYGAIHPQEEKHDQN